MTGVWGQTGKIQAGRGAECLGQAWTHMGPLMIRAISTLTSATNSCRSGYGSSTSEQLVCKGSLGEESKPGGPAGPPEPMPSLLVAAPPRPPAHPTPLLLLIRFPAGVHMNHTPHHAQTQAQVPWHGARLTVLIGVLLQHWWVHRGICKGEKGEVRARALPGHLLPGPEAPAGQLLSLPPHPACQEAGKEEAG